MVLQITPVTRREAVVTSLAQKGFEAGPAPSHVLCLHEGKGEGGGRGGLDLMVQRGINDGKESNKRER